MAKTLELLVDTSQVVYSPFSGKEMGYQVVMRQCSFWQEGGKSLYQDRQPVFAINGVKIIIDGINIPIELETSQGALEEYFRNRHVYESRNNYANCAWFISRMIFGFNNNINRIPGFLVPLGWSQNSTFNLSNPISPNVIVFSPNDPNNFHVGTILSALGPDGPVVLSKIGTGPLAFFSIKQLCSLYDTDQYVIYAPTLAQLSSSFFDTTQALAEFAKTLQTLTQ